MIATVQRFNRTLLLAVAPFVGMLIWILAASFSLQAPTIDWGNDAADAPPSLAEQASPVLGDLDEAAIIAKEISASMKKVSELYSKTNSSMSAIMTTAKAQVNRPALIYDKRITSRLGTVSDSVTTSNLTAQLFRIRAQKFSGYALKVKLKSAGAMNMVLGKDTFGGSETTLAAVKRTGAIAGVNAGGFADSRGKRYPLSTTVVNGKYVNGFEASFNDLFFVGLNDKLELIGGEFSSKEQLDRLNPKFGASFVPVLRKNGVNLSIPSKWQTSPVRAPRTVIANYKDDQLLFLVIDGRDENGSSGATLEEIQLLLTRYGAIDGYNLDGGGSSTLVFKGRVVNSPSDGQLRPLATNFLFFK
ncbi:phosphodiester glycosidase family protein [Cohnella thailandensis]|uniref:Phosphodiester glycosidase family protein n=1 Tax=Cohnella thailandensis TaxID=557557 RepID=A0A841SUG2_9BACL|nr:phosphodiester glycosidase family protein [Cohnella thailandensis]MBB6633848.1 phosphodiester glycosidase family protein [Cohnella thailandensis]MBP1972531.1 exopolysaccharide biosynthesis protein [Cohnella thailandensis]